MKPWKDEVISALRDLGGEASLGEIYRRVEATRGSLPASWQAIVRKTLEDHSSDSDNFRGEDLFYSAGGLGAGRWGLRSGSASRT